MLGKIIPTDALTFLRGVGFNHQPDEIPVYDFILQTAYYRP